MTAKDDPLITPELKLRAAVGLAAYQRPKPTPSHTEAFVAVEGYEEPKTVEEARALILTLGARLAKGEVSVQAHDALINGLKAYLGDKASSPDSKPLCALGKAHELREQSYPPRAGARSGGRRRHGGGGRRDFLHGGEPTFARVFDRRGSLLLGLQRLRDEPWRAFDARARMEAGKVALLQTSLLGGLPV
jgi:hypothetical protein